MPHTLPNISDTVVIRRKQGGKKLIVADIVISGLSLVPQPGTLTPDLWMICWNSFGRPLDNDKSQNLGVDLALKRLSQLQDYAAELGINFQLSPEKFTLADMLAIKDMVASLD